MGIHDLLQWWNLVYVVPLLISVAWILTTVFSGMHGHAGHAGHGLGHHIGDAAHHVGGAVNHAIHHDGSIHAHADAHGGHHGHDSHQGESSSRLIMLLGIDRAPVTLLIGVFMLCWGAFGLIANQLFGILHYPGIYIWPSLAVTFVASSAITRSLASIVGRLMPGDETYGVTRFELVGSVGKTIYATGETTGTVDISDRYGTVHRVQAKTEQGQEAIPAGADCIVVDFDELDKRFIVRKGSI